jgi:hypothetical protein
MYSILSLSTLLERGIATDTTAQVNVGCFCYIQTNEMLATENPKKFKILNI